MPKVVNTKQHPSLDLTLYSYNKRAFWRKSWTEEVINSRGHVYDSVGNVVSFPFPKFFNIGEHPTTQRTNVIGLLVDHFDEAQVNTKYNGHFAQLFYYEGQWINTTRGSFEHEFIEQDRQCIRNSGFTDEVLAEMPKNWTFLFEIIGDHDPHLMTPDHQQDFDQQNFAVLLAVNDNVNRHTIADWEYHVTNVFAQQDYTPPPMAYSTQLNTIALQATEESVGSALDDLKAHEGTEGYIIYIPSIQYRAKVKTDWFILNRYIFQFGDERTRNIFKKFDDTEKAFVKIPEELHAEYQHIIDDWRAYEAYHAEISMNNAEEVLSQFKNIDLAVTYIMETDQIGSTIERLALEAFIKGSEDYDAYVKESFMDKYRNFSLVERKAQRDELNRLLGH